jgi:hypothetical protein
LKAANGSINYIEQETLSTRCKPKNSISRLHSFSAADASEVKLRERFSVLETDTLEAVQQNLGFLKQKVKEGRSFRGNFKGKILLLGNSHGRGIGPMLQETLGSILKSLVFLNEMLLLLRLLRTGGNLVKALPSKIILS